MAKKTNGTAAKRGLVNSIEEATKKVEMDRWITTTPEGQEFVRNENAKKAQADLKAQFRIGQLVWASDVMDDKSLTTSGKPVNRCGKITVINDDCVETEMLYVQIDGEKVEEYQAWDETIWKKGDKKSYPLYILEKHIAKTSGNIWWKVK